MVGVLALAPVPSTVAGTTPAAKHSTLALAVQPTHPVAGERTTLKASVTPKKRGRRVVFSRKKADHWVRIGSARTNRHGVARRSADLPVAGIVTVRAVSAAYGGARAASARERVHVLTASKVSAGVPAGPWHLGTPVSVGVSVRPRTAGREVQLQRRVGSGDWARIAGPVATNGTGSAHLRWTPNRAGTASYRVTLAATSTKSGAATGAVTRSTVTNALGIVAPAVTDTGSVFGVRLRIDATTQAISKATLTVRAPSAGAPYKPPDDVDVSTSTHTATVTVGDVAKGSTKDVWLYWRAPDAPGPLAFAATLSTSGGLESEHATVAVQSPPEGSFSFDGDLRVERETRGQHYLATSLYGDCSTRVGARTVPGLAAALAAIDAYTADGTATDAWKDLHLAQTPEDADDVAMLSLASNRPDAALAAAIAAYRAGYDRLTMLNIAGAAADDAGHPEWAVALETAAAGFSRAGSVGASSEAVRLANLGHGRALMGQWGAAATLLEEARAADPENNLIAQEAAFVSYCSGDKDAALADYNRSIRSDDRADEMAAPDKYSESHVDGTRIWDTSGGVAYDNGSYTPPVIPQSIADLRGLHDFYVQQYHDLFTTWQGLGAQMSDLSTQLYNQKDDLQPATWRRLRDMLDYTGVGADSSVKMAWQHWFAVESDDWSPNGGCDGQFHDNPFCEYNGAGNTCGENETVFEAWKARLEADENAFGNYLHTGWPIWTGIEATTDNTLVTQYFDLARQADFYFSMLGIAQNLENSSNLMPTYDSEGTQCVAPASPAPPGEAKTDVGAQAGLCSAGSATSNMAFSLEGLLGEESPVDLGIKLSCSQIEISGGVTPFPFLSGFVKVIVPLNGSGATVFAGAKASIPNTSSFESSFYLTFNGSGRISDLGIDVGPEVEAGKVITVTPYSDHLHMSAMGLFTDDLEN